MIRHENMARAWCPFSTGRRAAVVTIILECLLPEHSFPAQDFLVKAPSAGLASVTNPAVRLLQGV